MEALVQVSGAVLGLGVGLAAARLVLTGLLAATFGRLSEPVAVRVSPPYRRELAA